MEYQGSNAYLTISEQKRSRYTSPIDMTTLDLHGARTEVDGELDRLGPALCTDDNELSRSQRATLENTYNVALARSQILRGIAKELARRSGSEAVVEGFEALLKDSATD